MSVNLPAEIWISIFRMMTHAPAIDLMLVCRAWRDLIQGDPYCWTRISICNWENKPNTHQYQLHKALEKSASLPLDIVAHITETSSDMALALAPHIGRIRTLRISALHDFQIAGFFDLVITRIDIAGKLILEELIIRTIEQGHFSHNRFVLGSFEQLLSSAPALRVLQFPPHAGEMPILSGLDSGLPSLSSLTLALAGTQVTTLPTGIFTFISGCPNLTSLTFTSQETGGIYFPFEDESQTSFREFDVDIPLPLHFLQLTSLTVSCPTVGVLILCSIIAPNLQSVILDGRDTQLPTEWDEWTSDQPKIALRTLATRSPGLINLEIIEIPVPYDTWLWLFCGCHAVHDDPMHSVEPLTVPFLELESLTVDELFNSERIGTTFSRTENGAIFRGMGDSIAGSKLSSLKRLHLRSVTTISRDALVDFVQNRSRLIQDNGTISLELVVEGCGKLNSDPIGELRGLAGITLVYHRNRRDDLFPRSWPNPYFPQRMFMPSSFSRDDSHLWVVDYEDFDEEENSDNDNNQIRDIKFMRRRTERRTWPRQRSIQ